MTTPSALSPEQSPEQSRDGSPGPDAEQERAQEAAPARDEATSPAPVEVAVAEPVIAERDTEPAAKRTEAELRTMLGLGPVGAVMPLGVRARGWIVTGVVGVIAALLRLIGLNHPKTLMFDEIYYVKDAYSLWHLGYEAAWDDKAGSADAAFAMGDFSKLTDSAAYVVHPQLGKWLIGAGMEIFGPESPFGWRFMPAVAGILTVMLLARLTMRLTLSPLLAGLAGLLLAIDGVALTESRIGLLDVFIGFFATLSLYCLVRDREWSRARLARRMAGTKPGAHAPHATIRPWLLAAGIALGLTCSIKWSGLYLVAVCGIAVVIWDTLALRRVRARAWFLEGTVAQGVSDFVQAIPVVIVVYVGCWWSWFTHLGAFKHGWTAEQIKQGLPVPAPWLSGYVDNSVFEKINDFIAYHQQMYEFHVGLDAPHTYQSKPSGWLLQTRPTSFFWEDKAQVPQTCGVGTAFRPSPRSGTSSSGGRPWWRWWPWSSSGSRTATGGPGCRSSATWACTCPGSSTGIAPSSPSTRWPSCPALCSSSCWRWAWPPGYCHRCRARRAPTRRWRPSSGGRSARASGRGAAWAPDSWVSARSSRAHPCGRRRWRRPTPASTASTRLWSTATTSSPAPPSPTRGPMRPWRAATTS